MELLEENAVPNDPYVRSALALAALDITPPLIRQSLMADPEFRSDFGLVGSPVLEFSASGLSIQRSKFLDAVRRALSGAPVAEVVDTDGRKWQLAKGTQGITPPALTMKYGDQVLGLPDLNVLSPNKLARLRSLDDAASDLNLPCTDRHEWHGILSQRPLDDEEIDEFNRNILDTPVHVSRAILGEFAIRIPAFPLSYHIPAIFRETGGSYTGSTSSPNTPPTPSLPDK